MERRLLLEKGNNETKKEKGKTKNENSGTYSSTVASQPLHFSGTVPTSPLLRSQP